MKTWRVTFPPEAMPPAFAAMADHQLVVSTDARAETEPGKVEAGTDRHVVVVEMVQLARTVTGLFDVYDAVIGSDWEQLSDGSCFDAKGIDVSAERAALDTTSGQPGWI
jgi:hypothetical protein